jgi:membrane protein implicated in regulation of membrane protease activity
VVIAIAGTLAVLFGLALTKAAQVRRVPVAVGTHRLVGEPAVVRTESLVFVDGELWQARSAEGSPLVPGEHVLVEGVEPDTLLLLVGSPQPAQPIQAERTPAT